MNPRTWAAAMLLATLGLPALAVGRDPACRSEQDDVLCVAADSKGVELLRLAVRDELYSSASRVRALYMIRREGALIQVPLVRQGRVVEAYTAATADCQVAALRMGTEGERIRLDLIRRDDAMVRPQSTPAPLIVDTYVLVHEAQQIPGQRSVFFEHRRETRPEGTACSREELLAVPAR